VYSLQQPGSLTDATPTEPILSATRHPPFPPCALFYLCSTLSPCKPPGWSLQSLHPVVVLAFVVALRGGCRGHWHALELMSGAPLAGKDCGGSWKRLGQKLHMCVKLGESIIARTIAQDLCPVAPSKSQGLQSTPGMISGM
jgi:hypothetical protein